MIYKSNRQKLASNSSGSLIVITAYHSMQLSNDIAAPFEQNAHFFWLTGIQEPGWKVIIDTARGRATLVAPNLSKMQKIFDGGLTEQQALSVSGADAVIESKDFESNLRQLARKHTVVNTVYDATKHDFVVNPAERELHETLVRIFPSVQDCKKQLYELRAIKSDDELKAMRSAIKLTCETFKTVRSKLADYKYEYELEADFTHAFRSRNAKHAYDPTVASGKNAITLHYIKNAEKLANNKLVLIDIGARVDGYCADITRTYGLNPTKRQIQVHAAVERARNRIIDLIGPDLLVSDYLHCIDEIMKDALEEVNLLKDRTDEATYRKYFPHAVSHGLGIDAHDNLGAPRYFKPGMVVTVEPGIYIAEENIGVRIEDDILITKSGRLNLSGNLSTSL